MSGWELLIEAGLFLGTVLLITTLQWTSVERARAHREWECRRHDAQVRVADWHVVLGVAVGCV